MESWSSWFKAPVLKTGVGVSLPRVRIPNFPPKKKLPDFRGLLFYLKIQEGFGPERVFALRRSACGRTLAKIVTELRRQRRSR